jgi:hypothetical protein
MMPDVAPFPPVVSGCSWFRSKASYGLVRIRQFRAMPWDGNSEFYLRRNHKTWLEFGVVSFSTRHTGQPINLFESRMIPWDTVGGFMRMLRKIRSGQLIMPSSAFSKSFA